MIVHDSLGKSWIILSSAEDPRNLMAHMVLAHVVLEVPGGFWRKSWADGILVAVDGSVVFATLVWSGEERDRCKIVPGVWARHTGVVFWVLNDVVDIIMY